MFIDCNCGDRSFLIAFIEKETGETAKYRGLPEFTYTIGEYVLKPDGTVHAETDEAGIFGKLEALGFGEEKTETEDEALAIMPDFSGNIDDGGIGAGRARCPVYPMAGQTGRTLVNLFGIISARQRLINVGIGVRRTFFVSKGLMESLLAHPPKTAGEFLQAIYGRDKEYRGVRVTLQRIEFTGFERCDPKEAAVHRQLADRIVGTAMEKKHVKAFTGPVKDRYGVMRVWLNAIGMIGDGYRETRAVMTGRAREEDRRHGKGAEEREI